MGLHRPPGMTLLHGFCEACMACAVPFTSVAMALKVIHYLAWSDLLVLVFFAVPDWSFATRSEIGKLWQEDWSVASWTAAY